MHAYKIETQISDSHHLHITLPASFPSGDVEVIVLSTTPSLPPSDNLDMRGFSSWLKQQAPSQRCPADIEAQIQHERNAWGDE